MGSDDVWIIVTDMKRQEMDDATEYFKLMCRYSFGRTCKPSMERKIQYERQYSASQSFSVCSSVCCSSRYAPDSHFTSATTNTLFPSDRSHISCHIARETTTIHRPVLTSNDIVFPNPLYASIVRSVGGYIF